MPDPAKIFAFAESIARMTADGDMVENLDGESVSWEMSDEDARDTVNALIDEARKLIA